MLQLDSYPPVICFTSISPTLFCFFFFFNDTATTEIYPLSLHDALPISFALVENPEAEPERRRIFDYLGPKWQRRYQLDRKSTRLNSSHVRISYAVFCLKKKKTL